MSSAFPGRDPDPTPPEQDPDRRPEGLPGDEPAVELSPKKARQGGRGLQVLMVLIGGLLLAALVWWLVEIYGGAIAPEEEQVGGDPAGVEIEEPGGETAP